jgi:hypothetical protein
MLSNTYTSNFECVHTYVAISMIFGSCSKITRAQNRTTECIRNHGHNFAKSYVCARSDIRPELDNVNNVDLLD